MRRIIGFILLIVVLVAAAAGVYGLRIRSSSSAQTSGQRTVGVQRGNLATTVEASGSLVPARLQTLTFGTSGKVSRILVHEGDKVISGTLLAELYTEDLVLQVQNAEQTLASRRAALAQLQATPVAEDVTSARASLDQAHSNYQEVKAGPSEQDRTIAETDLKKAEVAVQKAQSDYDKIAWRNTAGMTPQAATLQSATLDYERAKASYDKTVGHPTAAELATAQAQVAQAEAKLADLLRGPGSEELAQSEAQVEQARIALEQARLLLKNARIVAPFDGVVADIAFEAGDQVGSNGPGLTLIDPSYFYVNLQVDETQIGRLREEQPVLLTADAYPDARLRGQIGRISEVGQVTQGVVTYDARVDIKAADVPLRADMNVTAMIQVAQKQNVLLVPTRALRSGPRGQYVEVVQADGTTRQTNLQVGLSTDAFTEVVDGLQEGDVVVIPSLAQTGASQFRQGEVPIGGFLRGATGGGGGGPGGPGGGRGGP